MRRLATAFAFAATPFVAPLTASADTCTPATAMVILDKSSSMVTGTIGGTPKWDLAVDALTTLSSSYQSTLALGLMTFPNPDECSPGQVDVAPALGTHDAITAELSTPPPTGGNWTPMAQTLDVAATVPELQDPTRTRYVILISDGWQWCSPYDPATRFTPVDSVSTLTAQGVTTFVVGFGGAVDALALNQMAVEAGTALPGCDPSGSTPDAPNPCYYRADAPGELDAVLSSIALQLTVEACDGLDNDCDGTVDEELDRECTTACGTGVEVCLGGVWDTCNAPAVSEEVCDGIDNDCDGATDPGCACAAGEVRACGDTDEGACSTGTQTCGADGTWGACDGAVTPAAESCDGIDNDCDGEIDETTPSDDLCAGALVCRDGGCEDASDDNGNVPPVEGDADAASCDCRVGAASGRAGAAGGLALALSALVGAVVARSRRRRSS